MKIAKIFCISFTIALLSACGGGSEDNSTPTPTPKTVVELTGTVAVGVAIPGAEVTVLDKNGNELDVTATTDKNGNYTIEFIDEVPVPVQIIVTTDDGEELSAIVTDPESTTANVNPITTYVAESLLTTDSLDSISTDDLDTAGQETVEALFGEGAQYSAFASDEFVAKSDEGDFVTQVSAADVLLDSMADVSDGDNLSTLIDATIANETTLMSSPEFLVSVATNIALVDGSSLSLEEVYDASTISEGVSLQLSDVAVFQDIVEDVIISVEALDDLTDEESTASVMGLVKIIEETVVSDDFINLDVIDSVTDNVVDELLDNIVAVVTSEATEGLTSEELIEAVENSAEEIVYIIETEGVDLTEADTDLSTVEESLTEVVLIIENTADWDNGKWDSLVWQ